MKKFIAIAWLACLSLSAHAEDYFVNAELSATSYPEWVGRINDGLIANGFTYASSRQDKSGIGLGVSGGHWLSDNFGWELGYNSLGQIKGNTTADNATVFYTDNWKYSATAFHAAALGGVKLGESRLYGKLGIYSASSKLDGTFSFSGAVTGTSTYSGTSSNSGLLIGGGFTLPLSERIHMILSLDMFSDVVFPDWFSPSQTTKENLFKTAIGISYQF